MSIQARSTIASAVGALLTGALLTLTAVGQSTDDAGSGQKKHAACQQLTGQKQMDCEKRMTEMDKKNKAESSKIPTQDDKQPPGYTPPQ